MDEKIYARYVGDGFVNGVPTRNLTRAEWDGLSNEQRAACAKLYQIENESFSPKRETTKESAR